MKKEEGSIGFVYKCIYKGLKKEESNTYFLTPQKNLLLKCANFIVVVVVFFACFENSLVKFNELKGCKMEVERKQEL